MCQKLSNHGQYYIPRRLGKHECGCRSSHLTAHLQQNHFCHAHSLVPLFFAMLALASSTAAVDMGYYDSLPPPHDTTLYDVQMCQYFYASARVLVAEVSGLARHRWVHDLKSVPY